LYAPDRRLTPPDLVRSRMRTTPRAGLGLLPRPAPWRPVRKAC